MLIGGDVGNSHVEVHALEKVCVRTGPKFRPPEGHTLVIEKALHGLCTSGVRFHAKFAETFHALGFVPTHANPNVGTCNTEGCFKCVVACINSALTALKDPNAFRKESQSDPWSCRLGNIEEPKRHLGGDFLLDEDEAFCCGAQTCMSCIIDAHKRLLGKQPNEVHAPLGKDDKPESDDTPLLGPDGVKLSRALIGATQWLIMLSQFDVAHATMFLGHFCVAPHKGHLE